MNRLGKAGTLVLILAVCAVVSAYAGRATGEKPADRFDPAHLGRHVTVRTAFALRTAAPVKIDGKLDEADWAKAGPIRRLRAGAIKSAAGKPLYLRHAAESGAFHVAYDPTFVRILYDTTHVYMAITALVAPRAGKAGGGRDRVLLRFDPHKMGRHALEMVFNRKGLVRGYDSHETWAYSLRPHVRLAGTSLDEKSAARLGGAEAAAAAKIGKGAGGWLLEIAIPWRDLANASPPPVGEVWGLQVERQSAAGESSAWGRNGFNGFDPQGNVAFLTAPPAVRVVAMTFGRTLEGITPWTVYLENASDRPAAATVRLACRARVENEEFKYAKLAPGGARWLVAWMPFCRGINHVEVTVLDEAGGRIYHAKTPALVGDTKGRELLDHAGGYGRLSVGGQLVSPGGQLAASVRWEVDVRGRSPLGAAPRADMLFYLLPDGAGGRIEPLAISDAKAEPADPKAPFAGGLASWKLDLPKKPPEGFTRLIAVATDRLKTATDRKLFRTGTAVDAALLRNIEKHCDMVLSVPLYVRGPRLAEFAKFLDQTEAEFAKADPDATLQKFWHQATIRIPAGKDPHAYSAIFGARMTIHKARRLLSRADRNCSVLRNLPLIEADLKRRSAALAAGKLPRYGILWRAYKSKLDGHWQPYTIFVPENYDPAKKWPLVVDLHGYSGGWNMTPESGKVHAARAEGCLLMRPYLRGRGWYVGWAERELIDLIALLRAEYSVDADRISITGFSMGGSGTMKMLSSFPDLFCAGGGSAGRAEPLTGARAGMTPFWVSNGLKDQGTPWTGARMFQLHAARAGATAARFRGNVFMGHGYQHSPAERMAWFNSHPINRWPKRVRFEVFSARFASLRWVRQVEPAAYGKIARVTAEADGQTVRLTTANVAGLRLAVSDKLLDMSRPVTAIWNGAAKAFPAGVKELRLGSLSETLGVGVKTPGVLAGPMDDFRTRAFVAIQGTLAAPDAHAKAVNVLQKRWDHSFQGSVPVMLDTKMDRKVLAESNILAIGTEQSNAFLREHAASLPIRLKDGVLHFGSRKLTDRKLHYWFLTTNPLNPKRYLLVAGAVDPARCARGVGILSSMPARYWDYAIYGAAVAPSKSDRVTRFARNRGLCAFGWFDRNWRVYSDVELLPSSATAMDNLNPAMSIGPDGEWLPDAPVKTDG